MATSRTYWFGPKRLGFGISPRTWQGWTSILVYAAVMIGSSVALHDLAYRPWNIALKVIATGAFFALMIRKYDPDMH